MTNTAFGPQGPNYSLTRPPSDPDASSGADTFFKNCSQAGATDGTYATADFFNVVLSNLRSAVRNANVVLDKTNDLMLYQAIEAIATSAANEVALTATEGVKITSSSISLDYPDLAELDAIVAAALFAYFDPASGRYKKTTAAALASYVISTIAASTTVNVLPNVVSVTGQFNVFTRALLSNLYNVSEGVVTVSCGSDGYVDFILPYSYPDEKFTVLCQDTNGAGSTSGGPGVMITGVPLNGGTVRVYPRVPSTGTAYVGNLTFKYIAAGHSSN